MLARGELGKFEENKITYLNDNYDNEETQLTYYRYFKWFVVYEELKDKDLALFSRSEILDVISAIPTYSKRTINSIDSTLTNYMAWACNRGINPTGVNPMQGVSVKEHLENNINKNVLANKFIKKEELIKIRDIIETNSDTVVNSQDYLRFLLPFYGIQGNGCKEMIYLKPSDIDFTNETITIASDETQRVIKVDRFLLDVIQEAIDETEYIKADGKSEELRENGFVLKKIKRAEPVTEGAIRRSIRNISMIYSDIKGEPYNFTHVSLKTSGKFDKLRQIEAEKGELTAQDFKNIQLSYGDNENSYFGLKEDYYFVHNKIADRVE